MVEGASPHVVGAQFSRKGFFSKAIYARGVAPEEVEDRLGFHRGRLAAGWSLAVMEKLPGAADFEFAGYTHWSGGVAQGHLPSPPDPRTAEQRLHDDGCDVERLKLRVIAEVFTLSGAHRLAKVIPATEDGDYPQGTGVPQWRLVAPMPFRTLAVMGPGERYMGLYQ